MIYLLIITNIVAVYVSIKLFSHFAQRLGFMDIPNSRSMHTQPKVRGAGICFVGVSLITLFFYYYADLHQLNDISYMLFSILIVYLTGLVDDYKEISSRTKFILIIAASILLMSNGFIIKDMGYFLRYDIVLPIYVGIPLTLVAITGFTNAMNLMDGLDGLAGMISIIMLAVFFWIGYTYNDSLMMVLSSVFITAVATFLLFNWYPSKVFMGDSGSLSLGFVISVLAVRSMDYVQSIAVLFIIVLPVLDTFIVMTRRIQRGLSPFKADKTHMHHILYGRYKDVSYTVIILVYIQIAFAVIGVQLRDADNFMSFILFGILFFIFLNLLDQRLARRKNTNKAILGDWHERERKK